MSNPMREGIALVLVSCLLSLISPNALGESVDLRCVTPKSGGAAGEAFQVTPVALDASSAAASAPSPLRDGWPVNLSTPGAGFPYTPTLFDADGDGADEIFLTGGHTFGLRGDGTFLPGWPTQEHPYMGYGTNANMPGPSVADLEEDGDFEILWTERDWYAGSAHMWTFNAKEFDGTNLPNFPQVAPDENSNALDVPFVLGDTDGDGDLEAWGPHTLGNTGINYRLTGFDHQGDLLFTTDLEPEEDILCLYFGDADGNGTDEMFAVSFLGTDLDLYLFEADGSIQAGYPVVLHSFSSGYLPFGPPVPVDLEEDGDLEFILGHWGGSNSEVLCKHHDGSACTGFPIPIATSSQLFYVGLGDLTGDGEPELIATDKHLGSDYRVHAIDVATGLPLDGWPYAISDWPHGFPAVVDIDGDGLQDVCVSTDGGEVHAIAPDGRLHADYPQMMVSSSISGVAAGDIDDDGLFELVAATWDGWVYAWDTDGPALPGRAEWPMRGIDARNTGVFRKGLDPAGAPEAAQLPSPTLRLYPNPMSARGQIILGETPGRALLEIIDGSGRVIERIETRGQTTIPWTADDRCRSGFYWARLSSGDLVQKTPVVLIR